MASAWPSLSEHWRLVVADSVCGEHGIRQDRAYVCVSGCANTLLTKHLSPSYQAPLKLIQQTAKH